MRQSKLFIVLIIAIAMLISMLSGCKLARKDVPSSLGTNNQDILCGAFVTIGNSYSGDEEYEGIVQEDGTIKLKGLEGYYFGFKNTVDPNGDYVSSVYDKQFNDVSPSVNCVDNNEIDRMEVTLYCNSNFNNILNLCRVYQRMDKSYYGIKTPGVIVDNGGGIGSINISDSNKITVDGISKEIKTEFILNYAIADESQSVTIKQLNSQDKVIKSVPYLKGDSDNFKIDKDTAYIIVEEMVKNASGKLQPKRSIYSLDHKIAEDESITHLLYYSSKNNILEPKKIIFTR